MQVVFFDIEKYSKRRTQTQIATIDAFTECMRRALSHTGKAYLDYAQQNNLNLSTDLIKIPTGDGAAIVFTFEGLHDIHLHSAKEFLREAHLLRMGEPCEKFEAVGWCNCHPYFNLRVGIAEGKAILYRDINGGYNVAGGTINLAARVMTKMARNQIGFTESAYEQIVDMVEDPSMSDKFVRYDDVRIKHGESLTIYQYVCHEEPSLNSDPPEELYLYAKVDSAMKRLSTLGGFAFPDFSSIVSGDRAETARSMLAILEQLEGITTVAKGIAKQEAAIEVGDQIRGPSEGP